MSARTVSVVPSAEGTVRILVSGPADDTARKLARQAAQKAHGFGSVGKTPSPVKSGRGHTWTFSPVTVVRPAVAPAVRAAVGRKQTELAIPQASPMGVAADLLASLPESVQVALRGLLTGQAEPSRAMHPAAPAAPAEPEACEACHGYGVVRAAGKKAGKPFLTANGAATAPNATPCTTCNGPRVAATA